VEETTGGAYSRSAGEVVELRIAGNAPTEKVRIRERMSGMTDLQ
jgi:hypothetical protein